MTDPTILNDNSTVDKCLSILTLTPEEFQFSCISHARKLFRTKPLNLYEYERKYTMINMYYVHTLKKIIYESSVASMYAWILHENDRLVSRSFINL